VHPFEGGGVHLYGKRLQSLLEYRKISIFYKEINTMTALGDFVLSPQKNEIPLDRKYVIIARSEGAVWGAQVLPPPSSFITLS
jgi:hypothetical protein